MASQSDGALAASFSHTDSEKPKVCGLFTEGKCKYYKSMGAVALPPGTILRFMENQKEGAPGYLLCPMCYDHYMNKGTTIRRQGMFEYSSSKR
jgi:hypothetical protein